MDLSGRNAALAHDLLSIVLLNELLDVPKGDDTVLHTSSNDAQLIDLVDPVERGELSWDLSQTNSLYRSIKISASLSKGGDVRILDLARVTYACPSCL